MKQCDKMCDNFLHYVGSSFRFLADNDTTKHLLIVKKHRLVLRCIKKEPMDNGMTKMIPLYKKQKRIKLDSDLSNPQKVLESYLENTWHSWLDLKC